MDIDVRHLLPLLIIGSSTVVLGLSYLAVYMLGKDAARKEMARRSEVEPGSQPARLDRLDRLESAVDSIAVEMERLAEGQRFLLNSRAGEKVAQPIAVKPERRHATPV
jgi:hypothetical protein